jgi:hypothetical protein
MSLGIGDESRSGGDDDILPLECRALHYTQSYGSVHASHRQCKESRVSDCSETRLFLLHMKVSGPQMHYRGSGHPRGNLGW